MEIIEKSLERYNNPLIESIKIFVIKIDFWALLGTLGPKWRSRGSSEATKFIEIHRKVVRDTITTNITDQNRF